MIRADRRTNHALGLCFNKHLYPTGDPDWSDDALAACLPEGADVCLMAERFYGTADLISLCQPQDWSYELRLRGMLAVRDHSGKATTAVRAKASQCYFKSVELTARRVPANSGVLRDPGHGELWIVAMSDKPGT